MNVVDGNTSILLPSSLQPSQKTYLDIKSLLMKQKVVSGYSGRLLSVFPINAVTHFLSHLQMGQNSSCIHAVVRTSIVSSNLVPVIKSLSTFYITAAVTIFNFLFWNRFSSERFPSLTVVFKQKWKGKIPKQTDLVLAEKTNLCSAETYQCQCSFVQLNLAFVASVTLTGPGILEETGDFREWKSDKNCFIILTSTRRCSGRSQCEYGGNYERKNH